MTTQRPCFHRTEAAIARLAEQLPDMPQQDVRLTRLLYMAQGRVAEFCNNDLRQHGLNDTDWMALMVLYTRQDETVYPSDLSEALAFSRTNATRVVDGLVKQEWVERVTCSDDRRKLRLSLTDNGRAFVESLLPERHRQLRTLWQDFSPADKSQLEVLLKQLLLSLNV